MEYSYVELSENGQGRQSLPAPLVEEVEKRVLPGVVEEEEEIVGWMDGHMEDEDRDLCERMYKGHTHAPNSMELFYDLLLGTGLGTCATFMVHFKEDPNQAVHNKDL